MPAAPVSDCDLPSPCIRDLFTCYQSECERVRTLELFDRPVLVGHPASVIPQCARSTFSPDLRCLNIRGILTMLCVTLRSRHSLHLRYIISRPRVPDSLSNAFLATASLFHIGSSLAMGWIKAMRQMYVPPSFCKPTIRIPYQERLDQGSGNPIIINAVDIIRSCC